MHREMGAFLAGMGDLGPGTTTDQRVHGLIALGLVGVILVALTAILTRSNGSSSKK